MGEIGGAAEALDPSQANVGCDFAANFVAQPHSSFEIGQAGADVALAVFLAVEVDFGLRLQNEALRK